MRKNCFRAAFVAALVLGCWSCSGGKGQDVAVECANADSCLVESTVVNANGNSETYARPYSIVVEDDTLAVAFVIEADGLRQYVPMFDKFYVTYGGAMPEVCPEYALVVAGAYTKEDGGTDHLRIAGDHVSDGVRHKGYECDYNTGAFGFWNGTHHFAYGDCEALFDSAAAHDGAAFGQDMIIYDGQALETQREKHHTDRVTQYRALCEKQGKICVIESICRVPFKDFKNSLLKLGVTNAIYLDMGSYRLGWYRDSNGKVQKIHPEEWRPNKYSNFLVFGI